MRNKITHILRLSSTSQDFKRKKGIIYHSIYIKDNPEENIKLKILDSLKFLNNSRKKDFRVLVHCKKVNINKS